MALALWLGAAACGHKNSPASSGAAAHTADLSAANVDVAADGGAAAATKPPSAPAAATHVADGGAATAGKKELPSVPPVSPQMRQLQRNTQRALRGTRMPGLMPHGSLERGTLIYRSPAMPPPSPAPMSSSPASPPSAPQKQ
jgi:hypothetical protein